MEVQFGAAKVPKYAVSESGDTLEIIERPHGGVSAVLVDGQRSGQNAKVISNIVARKAISLLGEGVRDGAAARAAHDYLRTHRSGQVSAELQVLSVDLESSTVVISRNTHCPAYVCSAGECQALDEPSAPIGVYAHTKPVIREVPLAVGLYVLVSTDGVCEAGRRAGTCLDVRRLLEERIPRAPGAQEVADAVLAEALAMDNGRPNDDMSVLVCAVVANGSEGAPETGIRRLSARLPL